MFTFILQPLLDYRKLQEEGSQQEFAIKLQELENEKKLLSAIADERTVLARRFQELSAGKGEIKADDLALLTSRLELLRIRQRLQETVVMEKEQAKELSRLAMLEATRNKRVIELLMDRHFENYRMEVKRRETRVLDDFGVRSYSRRDAI
jgi:flagellar export protein FliJ